MLNYVKKAIFLLFLLVLSGCGAAIRHLDSSWVDDRTVYEKSQPLPPLEIPPVLTESQSISQVQSQPVTPLNEELTLKQVQSQPVTPLNEELTVKPVQSQPVTSPNEELTVKPVQSQPVTSPNEELTVKPVQSQPVTSLNEELTFQKENRFTRTLKEKVKLKDNSI